MIPSSSRFSKPLLSAFRPFVFSSIQLFIFCLFLSFQLFIPSYFCLFIYSSICLFNFFFSRLFSQNVFPLASACAYNCRSANSTLTFRFGLCPFVFLSFQLCSFLVSACVSYWSDKIILPANSILTFSFELWPTLHLVFGAKCPEPQIDERRPNIWNQIVALLTMTNPTYQTCTYINGVSRKVLRSKNRWKTTKHFKIVTLLTIQICYCADVPGVLRKSVQTKK